ncbi:MAG: ThiF family adenylyltransferase [Phycisphaerae bacterium]|nr:ThiF family adenylyltransferase [Phycisphaerae bacterium]
MTDDLDRYRQQMRLAPIGAEGQRRLRDSHALIVGCGALGSVAIEQLARAGVGRLTIVDRDVVDESNLQRQVLYDEDNARRATPKAEAAKARVAKINSSVNVRAWYDDFAPRNAMRYIEGVHVIVDGLDNLETRYLLNDLAVRTGIPYVYGAAVGTEGMCAVIRPGVTPCLRCVFPELPPAGLIATCDTAGVLGSLTALVASLEVTQAIKLLVGAATSVEPGLLAIDLWRNTWRRIDTGTRDPACPCCARREFAFLEGDRIPTTTVFCGRDAVQIAPRMSRVVDLDSLERRLASLGSFKRSPDRLTGVLADERSSSGLPLELTVFSDGRILLRGSQEPELARAIAARFVGT